MACDCTQPIPSGNTTFNIPVKIGEPLSNACQRAIIIGAIPPILRMPGFTLVSGATIVNEVSGGGIVNTANFFKSRQSCYDSLNGRLAGANCEAC